LLYQTEPPLINFHLTTKSRWLYECEPIVPINDYCRTHNVNVRHNDLSYNRHAQLQFQLLLKHCSWITVLAAADMA